MLVERGDDGADKLTIHTGEFRRADDVGEVRHPPDEQMRALLVSVKGDMGGSVGCHEHRVSL